MINRFRKYIDTSHRKKLWIIVLTGLICGNLAYARNTKKPPQKQDSSKATDWVASWRTCTGDGAIKRDGTLWQFGKVGGCDWGRYTP